MVDQFARCHTGPVVSQSGLRALLWSALAIAAALTVSVMIDGGWRWQLLIPVAVVATTAYVGRRREQGSGPGS